MTKNPVLTTPMLLRAFLPVTMKTSLEEAQEIYGLKLRFERIESVVREKFEPLVWNGGLRDMVSQSCYRGFSFASGLRVLVYTIAGRVMITLSRQDRQITLIADLDSQTGVGIQSISATEEEAVRLLQEWTNGWNLGLRVYEDSSVSLGV